MVFDHSASSRAQRPRGACSKSKRSKLRGVASHSPQVGREPLRALVAQIEEHASEVRVSVELSHECARQALDALERAHAERAGGVYGIKGSFLFAPLRQHPRFRALLKKLNLEEDQ